MLLAGPISHTSTQYIDFVDFYISMDLSTNYFAHLVGVELPLHVVVTILECCVTFSGVKLSKRSFVLFIKYKDHPPPLPKMADPGSQLGSCEG